MLDQITFSVFIYYYYYFYLFIYFLDRVSCIIIMTKRMHSEQILIPNSELHTAGFIVYCINL